MTGLGRRVSALAIIAVVATALLGSAYTLWYEDLVLQTVVETGTLDGEIGCGSAIDNEISNWRSPPSFQPPHGGYPEAVPLKDVAVGPFSDGGDDFPHEWVIAVSNTYPGYALDCEVEIINTGTVPWHVENIAIKVEECETPAGPCTEIVPGPAEWATDCPTDQSGADCMWGNFGISPPNYPDGLDEWSPVFVEVENWTGCQVHANNDLEASLFIGVNQSALELTTYRITLTYTLNQWNESAYIGCTNNGPILHPQ